MRKYSAAENSDAACETPGKCADLTRGLPPPFFGSDHSKGVAKADSGSAHSKGHAGQRAYGQNCHQSSIWSSEKTKVGGDGIGRNFLQGKCKEKSIEGQQKSAGGSVNMFV